MKSIRQAVLGFLAALFSSALILGGISLALLQGGTSVALAPTSTSLLMTEVPSIEITILPGEPTRSPVPPTPTETFPAPLCTPPDGWVQQAVGPDDTMQSLADQYGLPVEVLAEANCLRPSSPLNSYMTISVPAELPTPTFTATATASATARPTRTPLACGRPAGWQVYIVRRGDTLTRIALNFYTTVPALQKANCLTGTLIKTGQVLYVPNVATRTPTPTNPIPTTALPTVVIPTTAVPATTAAPATTAPTTAVPTTAVPTTAVPTTAVPTTAVPTTAVPTTAVPTAAVPTTAVPTTAVPTTAVPTTAVPTTAVPTTAAPPPTLMPVTAEPTSSTSDALHAVLSTWKMVGKSLALFLTP